MVRSNTNDFDDNKGLGTIKKRTPKNAESITNGALNLSLEERVTLRDKLTDSIVAEVELLETEFERAKNIAKLQK